MIAIGVDIGGTYIRIGCVDERHKLSNFVQTLQQTVLYGESPANLAQFIDDYIREHVGADDVAGICVGFPASVDKNRAVVLNAPNIQGFNGVDAKSLLQKHFEAPVIIEKDVNLLLMHDIFRYNLSENDIVIACYVGTGLGNAIMINGELLIGQNGVAGELGHIPAWDCDIQCSCGKIGCVEPLVAGKYLTSMQKELFPETSIAALFEKHHNDSRIEEYIRHLALPIATEINIIDPSAVILGGGVISMSMFPKEKLIDAIRFYARKPLPEANLKFVFSDNSRESGVMGAGIYMFRQLEE
ncbi:MAG: allose kinase [Synergistaceae bacterium]|nr:allose kinase [Synergistaceae bacterium]